MVDDTKWHCSFRNLEFGIWPNQKAIKMTSYEISNENITRTPINQTWCCHHIRLTRTHVTLQHSKGFGTSKSFMVTWSPQNSQKKQEIISYLIHRIMRIQILFSYFWEFQSFFKDKTQIDKGFSREREITLPKFYPSLSNHIIPLNSPQTTQHTSNPREGIKKCTRSLEKNQTKWR